LDDRQFEVIVSKLDSVLKILAINATQGKNLKEQVALLNSLGFQPRQIADMLGKTPNHISVTLHDLRKEKKQPTVEQQLPAETLQSGEIAGG